MNKNIFKSWAVVKMAVKNLWIHKVRASLTLIGIVIGICTVTVILSAGEGLKGVIVSQVQNFGSNSLFVEARPPELTVAFTLITTLKIEQMEEIIESDAFPHINKGYGYQAAQTIARSQYNEITIDVMGTNEDYIDIDSAEVGEGRFFNAQEEKSLKKVAVLGSEAAKKMFPAGNALNSRIKVDNITFTVIGVLKEKGPDLFMNVDKMVFIPLDVMQKQIAGADWIPYFALQVDDEKYLAESKYAIEQYLRKKHNIQDPTKDDFAVTTSDEAIELVESVLVGVRVLLALLACISLVVGGVGIMNIMYVTVTERIREIGLRKAIGAKTKDILLQFLAEAAFITTLGGIIGALLGITLTYLVSYYARQNGFAWNYYFSMDALFISVGVALLCGIAFGLAPARKAARQDPITALRYE